MTNHAETVREALGKATHGRLPAFDGQRARTALTALEQERDFMRRKAAEEAVRGNALEQDNQELHDIAEQATRRAEEVLAENAMLKAWGDDMESQRDAWAEENARLREVIADLREVEEDFMRLRHALRHESPEMVSCSCGATRDRTALEQERDQAVAMANLRFDELKYVEQENAKLREALDQAAYLTQDWNHPNADAVAALTTPDQETP